mmetsp:Transcript_13017/g.38759  ORF Transcript_13017/g.38759 Transcript_13017/m.38759 type:complete len:111 (-) Transcript_13017:865-1197(-)
MADAGVEIAFKPKNIDPEAVQGGLKAQERKEKAKQRWHNELIRFEIHREQEDGEVNIEKFRLPRRKCDERSIQNFVFRLVAAREAGPVRSADVFRCSARVEGRQTLSRIV